MKRTLMLLSAVCLTLLLTAGAAVADRMYVLPDSDVRKLTVAEIDEWDYESLGYAFNEIFARHGFNFEPGQDYDNYFRTMPWYTPNEDKRNQVACYPKLTSVEWYNVDLIKSVRAGKREQDYGRSIWDVFSTGFDTLQGFRYLHLRGDQQLAVYSAPSSKAWRGADGQAAASTNGAIYAAGWEGDWLLIMYEKNDGAVRVGYVNGNRIRGGVPMETSLHFDHDPAVVTADCFLTDDPATAASAMTYLPAGTQVTYLTRFYNENAWDYIEAEVDDMPARGFVRAGCIEVDHGAAPLESVHGSK
ncbi:MAG: YARHG domain-containing protein [Clostridia bacterium]|nr:YARHG domain-containing protein [Clostridia bacterium]